MGDETFPEELRRLLEDVGPSNYAQTLFRDRPYDGQPWTDLGVRGKQEVRGLTFRDLRDCYIRACYQSSGLPIEEYPKSLYKLPWDEMDPLAVFQNMSCEIEKLMGIFPNVPKFKNVWDHIPVIELTPEEGEVP